MISPDPSTAPDASAPQAVTRRSRPRRRMVATAVVLAGLAIASTACSPRMQAEDAVEKYWGAHSACAKRIVERESGWQADAVNRSSGATGLFQLMPSHAKWIKATYGYEFSEMKDPYKNSRVAKGLSDQAYRYWGDGWAPWRLSGGARRGGGCPA